jgi:hypothetical protein
MAEVDPSTIPLPEDTPPQPHQPEIKLPPFWMTGPRAWLTFVESRFRLHGIGDDQSRFDHMLSALPAEMISQVIDVVDTMPSGGLYEHFKNQLLEVHQLSDYEKFDVLVKIEPMGGPASQLLLAMLEFCPVGMEKHPSFHYLYMQRLPRLWEHSLARCSGETCADWLHVLTSCGLCRLLLEAWWRWRMGRTVQRRLWLQSSRLPVATDASSADEAVAEAASKRQLPRPPPAAVPVPLGLPPPIPPYQTLRGLP